MTDDELRNSLVYGPPEVVALWHDICDKQETTKRDWIAKLRAKGVKAAHPDDGWVDRENSTVCFCYPQFDDGPQVGDRIALGWPDGHRVVIVTAISVDGRLAPTTRYSFNGSGSRDGLVRWP